MSRTDAEIEGRLWAKLASMPAAEAAYNALPQTRGGKILSVDDARELSDDYLRDRTRSAAVHEPASAFIKALYSQRLRRPRAPGETPSVLFMAGGTGAGKTSSLRASPDLEELPKKVPIIYDSNMNSLASAHQKIREALATGHHARIVLVHRHPVDALINGALPRAMRQEAKYGSGRTVPLSAHLETHVGAMETIPKLAEHYAKDPRVHFTYIDNSRGPGKAVEVGGEHLPGYNRKILAEQLQAALDKEHRDGRISDAVYNGFNQS